MEERLRVNENVVNERAQKRCSTAVSRCDKRTSMCATELVLSGKLILKLPHPLSSEETNFRTKN